MKTLTGLDIYILTQEFPQLSLTEDTDIERYFEFRALNKHAEALNIYNTRLRQKYPDENVRILLMTYYRKKDRRFSMLLTQTLAALAQQTTERIKKTILFFVRTIAPLKHAEVYTLIQICEKVINAISKDRFAAISFSEKYVRYAEKLHFHAIAMRTAADILRMYITDTISSVREFKAEQVQQRHRKRQSKREAAPTVDFSKITFTKAQIHAIILPQGIVRLEDQVLAYTFKYWNIFNDTAFENIVLLYSRKYGTKHYSIFQAVKTGRAHAWKDEEILHAVLANVSNGYYYNISGDLYLQRTWRQIRAKLAAAAVQEPEPGTSKKKERQVHKTRQKQQRKTKTQRKKTEEKLLENTVIVPAAAVAAAADSSASPPPLVQSKARVLSDEHKNTPQLEPVATLPSEQESASAELVKSDPDLQTASSCVTVDTVPPVTASPVPNQSEPVHQPDGFLDTPVANPVGEHKTVPAPVYAEPAAAAAVSGTISGAQSDISLTAAAQAEPVTADVTAAERILQNTAVGSSPAGFEPPLSEEHVQYQLKPVEPMLSIAELIKKTTGKSYGVYKELFFKTIRPSIRVVLAKNTRHKFSLFGNAQNTAEKIIYNFMEESYNNPYQQWEGSDAQQAVFEEGFRISSLEDIIRHWAEHAAY